MESLPDVTVDRMRQTGVSTGDLVAIAAAPGIGFGLAWSGGTLAVPLRSHDEDGDAAALAQTVESSLRPRWVMWSQATATTLLRAPLRVAKSWDLAAAHRLIVGGWRADPARIWAQLHDLPTASIPKVEPRTLFNQIEGRSSHHDPALQEDGHLRAEWVGGEWAATAENLARWAGMGRDCAQLQRVRMNGMGDHPLVGLTARSESTTELLCAELSIDGLPIDRVVAESVIGEITGGRPATNAEAITQEARRDAEVLSHAPPGSSFDLRSPGQVKSLLRRVGIEVPDTRAWRLEALRDTHPIVDALLTWRKAERISTTYGYRWLDENVGADGRLRGAWSASDGAAGRMTASAGLHNLPATMREAVVAEPGHVFVRADLGQIEPRVLAVISGDPLLARATESDDLYQPVAATLSVDRATAKVAVLGAMYGQTTGHGAQALRGLRAGYPVAMAYLDDAERAGRAGRDIRTYGGRLVPMTAPRDPNLSSNELRARSAGRGRYARNALVQGAAAEFFKLWAVTLRAHLVGSGAQIVLCLHDELLVHTPEQDGHPVAKLMDRCLQEAVDRWAPDDSVRFVADISVIHRWSDAKP